MVIVVPCYREAERLPLFLPSLATALNGLDCRIQVVDDGSPTSDAERTAQLVARARADFGEQVSPLLRLPRNVGKGGAIHAGWLAHPAEKHLGFVDADGAISAAEVRRLAQIAFQQPEVALFASRVKMMGRNVERKYSRHLIGRVYASLICTWLDVAAYDTQCGLKIIPGSAFFAKADLFQERGFAVDVELLTALLEQGIEVQEVPINWQDVPGSKVRWLRDPWLMMLSILRIAGRRQVWRNQPTPQTP